MKGLALAVFAAALSLSGATQGSWYKYSGKGALISFELPSAWQVQSERTLEQNGYLVPPYPAYAVVAGAEPPTLAGVPNPPSGYAFSETPSPWFTLLVETATSPVPSPNEAYTLAPLAEVILQRSAGLDPQVRSLSRPVEVSSGGIRGSQDRSEVLVTGAGDIELDEVVYVKGNTVWMAMAGCTVACYDGNSVTVSRVIDSVRVGTAPALSANKFSGAEKVTATTFFQPQ